MNWTLVASVLPALLLLLLMFAIRTQLAPLSVRLGGPAIAKQVTEADCGAGMLTGILVLKEDVVCSEANPWDNDDDCSGSALCLGVGATLECGGHRITYGANDESDMNGVYMSKDSKLIDCHIENFEYGTAILVLPNATDVTIKDSSANHNSGGIEAPKGSSIALDNVEAIRNTDDGMILWGELLAFDKIRACDNFIEDLWFETSTVVSASGREINCGLCDDYGAKKCSLLKCSPC